jgi:hypothetical protein
MGRKVKEQAIMLDSTVVLTFSRASINGHIRNIFLRVTLGKKGQNHATNRTPALTTY